MAAFTQRDVETVMRTIFRRCVQCDDAAPSCAGLGCKPGQSCVQTPPTCDSCAKVTCQDDLLSDSSPAPAKPNAGAIAGGVIGGIVVLALLLFLLWKFALKGRRQRIQEAQWQETDLAAHQEKQAGANDAVSQRSTRAASTYTVASMASSVLTRASNIIQIAYIPGVTNRSSPGSPDVLVPPVPPIPAMTPSSRMTGYSEQHFFVPDFRNSTASGSTDLRSSYARTSIAPSLARASVASTVYRQNAIVSPLPAQTIVRGKAAVVSVKSSGSSSPAETPGLETPPVPSIESKHIKPVRIQMPQQGGSKLSPQNSVRSTATLGKVRALNITKKKATDVTPPKSSASNQSDLTTSTNSDTLVATPSGRPITSFSLTSTDDGSTVHGRARRAGEVSSDDSDSDDDDNHERSRRSLLRDSRDSGSFDESPTSLRSPFSDAHSSIASYDRPQLESRFTSQSMGLHAPMTPIMEESGRRASNNSSKRAQSPFGDEYQSDLK